MGDTRRGVLGDGRVVLAGVGVLVAPGAFYGPEAARHVRVALRRRTSAIGRLAERLAGG